MSTEPEMVDPDEDEFGETPRLADDLDQAGETGGAGRSTLRTRLTEPEMDARMGGKAVSRADLSRWFVGDDDDEDAQMPEGDDDEEEDSADEGEDKDELMTRAAEEADRLHRELMTQGRKEKKAAEGDDAVRVLDEKASEEDTVKAAHTVNQTRLWEALIEARIHMQPLLAIANRMPHPETHALFCSEEGTSSLAEASQGPTEVLHDLDMLECELWNAHEELVAAAGKAEPLGESMDIDAEWEHMQERSKRFQEWQSSVLERWYERTQIGVTGAKKFKAVNLGTVRQIEQALEDKQRLIRRAQIRRATLGRVLGEPRTGDRRATTVDESKTATAITATKAKEKDVEVDEEIFDDTDFYGDLLRELIESTRQREDGLDEGMFGGVAVSELKRLRRQPKKRQRNVSKGRTLKFDPHPLLVNFMAPVDTPTAKTDWDTQQLFSNLFGRNGWEMAPLMIESEDDVSESREFAECVTDVAVCTSEPRGKDMHLVLGEDCSHCAIGER
jgi:protein AATF/BFR2